MCDESFKKCGVKSSLVHILKRAGIEAPTKIQKKSLPIAIKEGKDCLIKSHTGSGKTLIPCIAILNNLISMERIPSKLYGVIIVPTSELSKQTVNVYNCILKEGLSSSIRVAEIGSNTGDEYIEHCIATQPHIIVSTPGSLEKKIGELDLDSLRFFVIDEADLMFNLGYKESIRNILQHVTKLNYQGILLSATLDESVNEFKSLMLKDPVTVEVENKISMKVNHYIVKSTGRKRYCILYMLLMTRLIKGKILIFTNSSDNTYRLSLFFKIVGIRHCVLSNELPIDTRISMIEDINNGVYDVGVGTDEGSDSGVERGIDFQGIEYVINFDLPREEHIYTHRAGRTGRAGEEGSVLTFIQNEDDNIYRNLSSGIEFNVFDIDMKSTDAFDYRVSDILNQITPKAILKSKLYHLKLALKTSETLQTYFNENPTEKEALISALKRSKVPKKRPSLEQLPKYLLYKTGQSPEYNVSDPKKRKKKVRDPLSRIKVKK